MKDGDYPNSVHLEDGFIEDLCLGFTAKDDSDDFDPKDLSAVAGSLKPKVNRKLTEFAEVRSLKSE